MDGQLTESQKKLLFWASFLALAAAGMGFAFRVAHGGSYGAEFQLTDQQIGNVFGASLWPIAITMIGFSLVLDKTGFKIPMYVALVLQGLGAIGTAMATNYDQLYIFALCAGLGHGIVEAVINPVCAAVYPKDKTVKLTILHAAWPAGLVFGTLPIIAIDGAMDVSWRVHSYWMAIPVIAYGLMYLPCKFPIDERVKAGVPFQAMLKEVGFLTAFLAGGMMVYEIGNQVDALTSWTKPEGSAWFFISMGVGVGIGAAFGAITKSIGKPLFFLMCLMMIPVATAELATDGWIKGLMNPVLETWEINAAFALVFSAFIMLILRTFAAPILRLASPPTILAISGLGSAVGLWWLGSGATGIAVFIAFTIYAMGQTYYWPCVLGFVSERYPQGGALTLNTVSAVGLLSVGIIGIPLLGVTFDKSNYSSGSEKISEAVTASEKPAEFLGMTHTAIDPGKMELHHASLVTASGSDWAAALSAVDKEGYDKTLKEVSEAGKDEKTAASWKEFKTDAASITAVKTFGSIAGEKDAAKKEANLKTVTDSLDDNGDAAADKILANNKAFGEIRIDSGRYVLKFAAIFPGILIIVFGGIALYFRARGGYKPIDLDAMEEGSEF
jgi:MFS family permease